MPQGNFFTVQNAVFAHKLPSVAFMVYCYLCRCNNRERGCFPSKSTIARECGISVSSVSRSVKLLDERDIVMRQANYHGGRRRNNSYSIVELALPSVHGEPSVVSEGDGS